MRSEDKSIVIISPGFPSSESDTTCLPMQQALIRKLNLLHPGLKITVFALQYPYRKDKYNWFGNEVFSFDGRNRGGIHKYFLRRQIYSKLHALHQAHPVAGILSFWYGECALVGHRFGDKHGIRNFCWVLGQDARKENPHPSRLRLAAGQLVALSDFLQEEFQKNHGIRPAHVITPGVEYEKPETDKRDIDLLAVGSLIPLKQFEIFVHLVASLKTKGKKYSAVLAGSGPGKIRLEQLATELGIAEDIRFTGEIPYDEVLNLMGRSRVLIHPSSYEGFSGVCQEALAAGMHVISFCRAMHTEIEHWHIVNSEEEMEEKALKILSGGETSYTPVLPYRLTDTATKLYSLLTS